MSLSSVSLSSVSLSSVSLSSEISNNPPVMPPSLPRLVPSEQTPSQEKIEAAKILVLLSGSEEKSPPLSPKKKSFSKPMKTQTFRFTLEGGLKPSRVSKKFKDWKDLSLSGKRVFFRPLVPRENVTNNPAPAKRVEQDPSQSLQK